MESIAVPFIEIGDVEKVNTGGRCPHFLQRKSAHLLLTELPLIVYEIDLNAFAPSHAFAPPQSCICPHQAFVSVSQLLEYSLFPCVQTW